MPEPRRLALDPGAHTVEPAGARPRRPLRRHVAGLERGQIALEQLALLLVREAETDRGRRAPPSVHAPERSTRDRAARARRPPRAAALPRPRRRGAGAAATASSRAAARTRRRWSARPPPRRRRERRRGQPPRAVAAEDEDTRLARDGAVRRRARERQATTPGRCGRAPRRAARRGGRPRRRPRGTSARRRRRARAARSPFHVSSIRLPSLPRSAPEIVPEAIRSPVRMLAPFEVACASCCGIVQ